MFIVTVFSGSVMASTSGDEHRTSHSQRLGDDNGESSVEPECNRAEDRTRMEDTYRSSSLFFLIIGNFKYLIKI